MFYVHFVSFIVLIFDNWSTIIMSIVDVNLPKVTQLVNARAGVEWSQSYARASV